jgi:capsular exopolysaccharide synthesis family protein
MAEESAAPTLSPFELLAVLWRRRTVVVATVVISVALALVLSLRSPKQYSASAQLLFRDPGFAQALFGNNLFSTGQQEAQRTIQTNIDVVTSLNVAVSAESLLRYKEPVGNLMSTVTVNANAGADVATIKAVRSTPREAAAVANAFAEGYITYRRQTDRSVVAQAEELLNQSLKTATSKQQQTKIEDSVRQLGVLRSLQTGDAEVIARAQPDPTPVSPKPKRDGILGFVVGLLLGCGLALLVDFLDRRLKTLEDFERACPDWPLLASVPSTPGSVVASSQLTGPTGEAYRILREGLRFIDPVRGSRCYVVTSAEEGEGKSTVAVNLATALAAVGRRVILLEADMRRPAASKQLGVRSGSLGLSELLVSDADLDEFLVEAPEHTGLFVLPSGIVPPNSADLLSAGRMTEVLAAARESADVVIVDSPPLLPVADTRVLMGQAEVDGVLMIGRADVSRRDRIRTAAQILAQSGVRVFGLVVTDVKQGANSRYYEYGYDEPSGPSRPTDRPTRPRSQRSRRVRSPT